GSFLFWQGGAGYFNLTGSKILASVGQISVAFPTSLEEMESALIFYQMIKVLSNTPIFVDDMSVF
ncbi:MAG: hypothetical protein E7E95_04165, partial [Prevotella bivia]|nr:hypothetical protein [Prevotella bivia]